ncbi:MAG: adenosylcobinamide-GDP ribazoletransferase [Roseovarius sp.]
MAENDAPLAMPEDVIEALALLSRLPVPPVSPLRGAAAAWAYPVAGLVLGAITALAGLVAHGLGLPAPLAALVALGASILLTGALHEDGLADTADGLWGGWTRERRLEIMKDSTLGAYGAVALFLVLSARWAALWMLFELGPTTAAAAILVAACLSRGAMPAVMAALPNARGEGLSARVGTVGRPAAGLAVAIACAVALVFSGGAGLGALVWAAGATALLAIAAYRKIGGQTGDILGAVQQVAEVAVLFSLLA